MLQGRFFFLSTPKRKAMILRIIRSLTHRLITFFCYFAFRGKTIANKIPGNSNPGDRAILFHSFVRTSFAVTFHTVITYRLNLSDIARNIRIKNETAKYAPAVLF